LKYFTYGSEKKVPRIVGVKRGMEISFLNAYILAFGNNGK
jgi:hypothetical protein